jgi:hypothetical protein
LPPLELALEPDEEQAAISVAATSARQAERSAWAMARTLDDAPNARRTARAFFPLLSPSRMTFLFARPSAPPTRATFVAVGVAVLVVAGALVRWGVERREDARLREGAIGACAERLGEAACQEHLAANHEDCARLTRKRRPGVTGAAVGPTPNAYLECVVLGVDAWVSDNGRRARQEAEVGARHLSGQ